MSKQESGSIEKPLVLFSHQHLLMNNFGCSNDRVLIVNSTDVYFRWHIYYTKILLLVEVEVEVFFDLLHIVDLRYIVLPSASYLGTSFWRTDLGTERRYDQ